MISLHRYIKKKKLCNKKITSMRRTQTFFNLTDQEKVEAICRDGGFRVKSIDKPPKDDSNNYCISDKAIGMYVLSINKKCKVTSADVQNKLVIVSCDLFDTECLPVHFEAYNKQKASNISCSGGRVSGLV